MRRGEIVASIIDALKPLDIPLYEWRVTPAEYSELPIIVIRDKGDVIDTSQASFSAKHTLKIEIEYTSANQQLTPKEIRQSVQNILSAIKEANKNAPIGDYIAPQSVDIDFEHHELIVGRALLELEVIYYSETLSI